LGITVLRTTLALTALLFGLIASAAHAATVTVVVTEDASVEQRNPSTNFGSGNDLVGGVRRGLLRIEGNPQRFALLKFQVPAPSGTVSQVRLRLFKRSGSPSEPFRVQSSPCSWSSSAVTWNTRPTLGAVLATLSGYPTGSGWVEFVLPVSAGAQGQRCFAIIKPSSSSVFITADDLQAPNPSNLVITTTADTTPPETTITAGPSGSTPSTAASFSFSSSESGSTLQCALDGAGYQACTSPTTYQGLVEGNHQFSVRAIDATGNVDPTPATRAWTIAPPPPPTGYCASPAVTNAWTGTGTTIAATPSTLQSAIASASPGDTVELADGTYDRATVTLTKAIRLKAAHRFGAVFVGGPTPRYANDVGLGSHIATAVAIRASGTAVEGIEFRYYDTGIDLDGVADTLVQGNRILSVYSAGVQVWDTRNTEVRCNEILDPYLAQDPTATVTSGPSIPEAQADYGVVVYGSLQPRVEHNYFFGVFNQTLSFKEGDWDPYAGYNTFEGSALTALFFGQNIPHNGPYSFTGLPVDNDRGALVGEFNVFREVYGVRAGANVVYYVRSPIRVWHVDGSTTLRGNVIEQAQQGVLLECRAGSQAGCDAGTTRLTDNTIAGRVRDLAGTVRQVNTTAGVLVFTGLRAATTIDANAFALLPRAVGIYSDGVSGTPSYTYTNNREFTAPPAGANLNLRAATPATDPDLSYADAYR
jgi:hypothetical protein